MKSPRFQKLEECLCKNDGYIPVMLLQSFLGAHISTLSGKLLVCTQSTDLAYQSSIVTSSTGRIHSTGFPFCGVSAAK